MIAKTIFANINLFDSRRLIQFTELPTKFTNLGFWHKNQS